MCRLIHSFLFNMVMPILGSIDYVSGRDKFCMYKVIVGEKINLPKVIFYYWLQAFKDRFNPKVKKNHVPYGILFNQIMRDVGVDVFGMAPSGGATQHKEITFVKMEITDNFQEYA